MSSNLIQQSKYSLKKPNINFVASLSLRHAAGVISMMYKTQLFGVNQDYCIMTKKLLILNVKFYDLLVILCQYPFNDFFFYNVQIQRNNIINNFTVYKKKH